MATATLEQATADYMSLAEGVGIIPEKYRNRGYDKLEFDAGEGGIGAVLAASPAPAAALPAGGVTIEQFLAGIAAGAEPSEFAKQLLGGDAEETADQPRRRGKAATQ